MDVSLAAYLEQSADIVRLAAAQAPEAAMGRAVQLCVDALKNHKAVLTCGNGGSAADASHIAGEFVGRFLKDRNALRCVCLSDSSTIMTAWGNDASFDTIFARQVEAHGEAGGVLIALSTSGNSPNVLKAAEAARAMGVAVIGLTGNGGGKLAPLCDVLLEAPGSANTSPLIQQVHSCLYHYLCGVVEARMAEPAAESRKKA